MPKVKALERKVTSELLVKKGACKAKRGQFDKLFPNGAKITRKNLRLALPKVKEPRWVSCVLLRLANKTYLGLLSDAKNIASEGGVNVKTPLYRNWTAGFCRIYADVLADYLELP